jgi:hypothetical protein
VTSPLLNLNPRCRGPCCRGACCCCRCRCRLAAVSVVVAAPTACASHYLCSALLTSIYSLSYTHTLLYTIHLLTHLPNPLLSSFCALLVHSLSYVVCRCRCLSPPLSLLLLISFCAYLLLVAITTTILASAAAALAQLNTINISYAFGTALANVLASLTIINLTIRAFAPSCLIRIFGKVAVYYTTN